MTLVYKRLKRGWNFLQRRFSETITIRRLTSETLDAHDVKTESYTETQTKAVVYNTADEFLQQEFGDLAKGEYIFLIKSHETLSERDSINYSGVEYRIMNVEPLNTQGGLVGKLARCKRKDDV